jgi:hypothetical protein
VALSCLRFLLRVSPLLGFVCLLGERTLRLRVLAWRARAALSRVGM